MKYLFIRTVVFLVICAAGGVTASATTLTREVAFGRAVTVNGTPVKAGTYKVTFDDQTGELTVLKGKTVVAKAPARLEKAQGDSRSTYSVRTEAESTALLSVNMKGGNQATIISGGDGKEEKAR